MSHKDSKCEESILDRNVEDVECCQANTQNNSYAKENIGGSKKTDKNAATEIIRYVK